MFSPGLNGKWAQTRTEADARLLLQEHKFFGKPRRARSRRQRLLLAGAALLAIGVAVVSGLLL